jgi:hypothetical protein
MHVYFPRTRKCVTVLVLCIAVQIGEVNVLLYYKLFTTQFSIHFPGDCIKAPAKPL